MKTIVKSKVVLSLHLSSFFGSSIRLHNNFFRFPLQLCFYAISATDNFAFISPKAGVSSSSSSRTRPLRNWPGKNNRFVLSKRMRNFINFRGIVEVFESKYSSKLSPSEILPPVDCLIKACTLICHYSLDGHSTRHHHHRTYQMASN